MRTGILELGAAEFGSSRYGLAMDALEQTSVGWYTVNRAHFWWDGSGWFALEDAPPESGSPFDPGASRGALIPSDEVVSTSPWATVCVVVAVIGYIAAVVLLFAPSPRSTSLSGASVLNVDGALLKYSIAVLLGTLATGFLAAWLVISSRVWKGASRGDA
jgi:hypothetical protein